MENTNKLNENKNDLNKNKREININVVKKNTGYPNYVDFYEAEYESYPYK